MSIDPKIFSFEDQILALIGSSNPTDIYKSQFTERVCRLFAEHIKEEPVTEDRLEHLVQRVETRYTQSYAWFFHLSLLPFLGEAVSQAKRIEMANSLVQSKTLSLVKEIQKYGIKDEKERIKLAKIAADYSGRFVAFNIKNFSIQDEDALIEIAEICLRLDPSARECISKFGIQDKRALLELAKIAAESRFFPNLFTYFGIKDEQARIEVLKIAAAHQGSDVSEHIQSCDIKDEEARIAIAKIAAGTSAISSHIKKYGIKNKQALIEIAEITAAVDPLFCENFEQFGIDDEDACFSIANIVAREHPVVLINNISKFRITLPQAHIALAKSMALNLHQALKFMRAMGIRDQKAIVEIAKVAAREFSYQTSSLIAEFGITDERERIAIAKIAAERSGWGVSEYFHLYGIQDKKATAEIALIAARENGHKTRAYIDRYGDLAPEVKFEIEIKALLQSVASLEYERAVAAVIFEKVGGVPPAYQKALFELRNPLARKSALALLWENRADLAFAELRRPEDVVLQVLAKRGAKLCLSKKERREGRLSQQILLTFSPLLQTQSNEVLDRLCVLVNERKGSQEKIKALQMILAVENLGKSDLFSMPYSLDEMLRAAFESIVKIEGVDDLAAKFMRTFYSFRNSNALFVYLGRLNTLPASERAKVLPDFKEFVTDVLNGDFAKKRYENTDLPLAWTEGARETIEIATSGAVFNFRDELLQKLGEGHLQDQSVVPYIEDFSLPIPADFSPLQAKLVLLAREGAGHLEDLQKLVPGDAELANDVAGWIQALGDKQGLKRYTLVDTDDPEDMMLMGSEVLGSCQRLEGDPNLNKGILGTMLSGPNRLLALKEEPSGKIRARALFRYMDDDGKPALLIERIYPQTLSRAEKEALVNFAKRRAKALGLPLYSTELEGKSVAVKLSSRGGRGAYQYVDSAGGMKPNGLFHLYKAVKL